MGIDSSQIAPRVRIPTTLLVRALSGVSFLTFPGKRWALRHGGKDLEQLERTVRDRLVGAHQALHRGTIGRRVEFHVCES